MERTGEDVCVVVADAVNILPPASPPVGLLVALCVTSSIRPLRQLYTPEGDTVATTLIVAFGVCDSVGVRGACVCDPATVDDGVGCGLPVTFGCDTDIDNDSGSPPSPMD